MFYVIKERGKRCTSKQLPRILYCFDSGADLFRTDFEIPVFPPDPGCCDTLGCWAAYTLAGREHGLPSGMACTGSASKQNVLIPVIPSKEAGAVQVGLGRQRSHKDICCWRQMYFSCNSPINAFVQLLLGQEHLLAKWHNQERLGIGVCLFLPSPLPAKCWE